MNIWEQIPLPSGWTTPPVYARYAVQLGKMLDQKRIKGTNLAAYLRNVDVQWGKIYVEDLPQMDFGVEDRDRLALRDGDLLVCEGGEIGRSAIWREQLAECFYQKALHRLRTITFLDDPRFFYYFMHVAVNSGLFGIDSATTIHHLPAEKLRVTRYPAPPLKEQCAIADFLDAETARIDELIAAKENLLALLAEKRRALVTEAVTRGLDPDVPMRDSGIPWLGEIPAHWDAVRLRFLFDKIEQGWSPLAENRPPDEDRWGVLKLSAVSRGRFEEGAAKAMPPELEARAEYEVKPGDFLLTRANTPSSVGDVCYVETTRPKLMLCDLIYRLSLRDHLICGQYLSYFLVLPLGRSQIEADARGTSSSMVKISQDHIKSWRVPLPPLTEQVAIVEQLSEASKAIAKMRSATSETIRLLRERRDAVIAAAVTGKLDLEAA